MLLLIVAHRYALLRIVMVLLLDWVLLLGPFAPGLGSLAAGLGSLAHVPGSLAPGQTTRNNP